MHHYQTIIQNAVATVQQKGLDVTVARVKQHLGQPVPMGFLMPAVQELRKQQQQSVKIEPLQEVQPQTMPQELMQQEIESLKLRVSELEKALSKIIQEG